MAFNDNIKGALLMSLAMASFTFGDAMIKLVAGDLATGQIMFIRGVMTSAILLLVAWRFSALRPVSVLFDRWIALRSIAEVVAAVTYIHALSMIPLPNAAAILQALPLAVTMGAALFFGEAVGWRRWLAILVGFVGVLIIIRPGAEGFSAASVLVVASVIMAATRDLATKRIDPAIPSLMISAAAAVSVAAAGGFMALAPGAWRPVSTDNLIALGIGAVALSLAYQAVIMAMRTGEISFIAPFRYTSLLWAIVLGILLLAEMPDAWMLAGAAVVVAAGLYAFYRETAIQRRRMAEIESNLTVS